MEYIHFSDQEFQGLLDHKLIEIPGVTAFYSRLSREYDHLYLQDKLIKDLSFFILYKDGAVAGFAPLYLCNVDGEMSFSYDAQYLAAPVFRAQENDPSRSKVEKAIFDHIEELAEQNQVKRYKAAISPILHFSGITFINYLLSYGFEDKSSSSSVLDLSLGESVLWQRLRKSYKGLINKMKREYETIVIDSRNWELDLCENYRKLHLKAAGRATRALETFHTMYEMVRQDQGFIVLVFDREDKYVGASFYLRYNGSIFYGSSATIPEISHNAGIGHLNIWKAVQYSINRGDRFFEIGQVYLPNEEGLTDKLKSISHFKSGFGGRKVTWFRGERIYR
ncbi:MAG: hypothetical protein ACE5GM_10310 [bacterium]